MNSGGALDWLARCDLPRAWGGKTCWAILDADFGDARAFVQCWQAWRLDHQRPRILHYVGIAAHSPSATDLANWAGIGDQDAALWQALAAQCADRGTGFHRILLDEGRVSLTLCIGDVRAVLKEHIFLADTVRATTDGDPWVVQGLARRCKRGARFYLYPSPAANAAAESPLRVLLEQAGFAWDASTPVEATAGSPPITGQFNPPWEIPTRRSPLRHANPTPAHCAVIGAGISGASVAHALALRGWKVTVLDQAPTPARAASGLPVGLASAHVSADDSPLSRLSRSGVRLAIGHAQQLLSNGQDWELSGVLERKPGATAQWQQHAAWIKPSALVSAWLDHPNITFVGLTPVDTLHRVEGLWHLGSQQTAGLGGFEQVVIANAMGCKALLRQAMQSAQEIPWDVDLPAKLSTLQALHGTLSHGVYAEDIDGLPSTPVNGNGGFFPHVPSPHGMQWASGSTFETDALAAADLGTQHATNMLRLRQLLPEFGDTLVQVLERGPVHLWSSTRCVTHDRLPLVGAVDAKAANGLWVSVGMGARGLGFAPLCAQLLVARMGGEPLPVEWSLARSLDVCRTRRTRTSTPNTKQPDDQTF